jgi:hypothetical protein
MMTKQDFKIFLKIVGQYRLQCNSVNSVGKYRMSTILLAYSPHMLFSLSVLSFYDKGTTFYILELTKKS